MDKKNLIIAGSIAAATAIAVLIFRRMTSSYANMSTLINSVMGNYFTIDELCYSDTAKAKGIDNTPNAEVKANLANLINNVLNPIREKYGKPIRVSSGYRCTALNKAVGGVNNSQHLTGQAADLVATNGGSLADIFKAAIACNNYDQLIWEGPKNSNTKWVHVSYADKPRREILYYNGNGYTNIASNWQNYVK